MKQRTYLLYIALSCLIMSMNAFFLSYANVVKATTEDYYSGPAGVLVYAEHPDGEVSSESAVIGAVASRTRRGRLLGRFKTTAYCSDPRDGATGLTATGTVPRINHTVAANFREIAPGTKVMLEGSDVIYTVEDTGNYTGLVDVFLGSYDECIQYGVRYRNVYLVEE